MFTLWCHPLSVSGISGLSATFTAGGGGVADDLIIWSGNAPFAFRILDTFILLATFVVASTMTLRSGTGGGGSALSSVLSSASTGRKRDTSSSTATIAVNGTLVWRRSDNGVAGEAFVRLRRETP